jgi:hypothetical protein
VHCLSAADPAVTMNHRIDVENEIRAVVFGDLVKRAQKVVNDKATFVLVARARDMDYVAKRIGRLKPLALCFVAVKIDSERTASAEASFGYAELGGQFLRYKLSKHKDGWSIVSVERTGAA